MSAVLPQADERSRKNLSTILQALGTIGQNQVAQALGISESTVSRMKDGELAQTSKLLSILKLKVVPEEFECVDPEYLAATELFAQRYLAIAVEKRAERKRAGATGDTLKWDEK